MNTWALWVKSKAQLLQKLQKCLPTPPPQPKKAVFKKKCMSCFNVGVTIWLDGKTSEGRHSKLFWVWFHRCLTCHLRKVWRSISAHTKAKEEAARKQLGKMAPRFSTNCHSYSCETSLLKVSRASHWAPQVGD